MNVDLVYFVNYLENAGLPGGSTRSKSDYVTDNLPYDTMEPFDRAHYPLRAPSSITYASMSDSLIFADTDNDRIMRLSFANLNILLSGRRCGRHPVFRGDRPAGDGAYRGRGWSTTTRSPGRSSSSKRVNTSQVLYVDAAGKVRLFAGTGAPGFSGDGGPATAAGLNDPRAIAVDSRGNAYIADYGNHAVRMVVGGALP